jgi:hypothetical protein
MEVDVLVAIDVKAKLILHAVENNRIAAHRFKSTDGGAHTPGHKFLQKDSSGSAHKSVGGARWRNVEAAQFCYSFS